MHTFQPYPIGTIEINPFKLIGQQWGAITAEKDGKCNSMTASWGGMGVLWNRNVCTIYVRESRYTKEFLDASDGFSVTFFDDKYRSSLKYLGAVSGRDEDKLAGARLHINHDLNVPFIDEGNFVLICKKLFSVPITKEDIPEKYLEEFYKDGDYHTMYVGEIVDLLAR